LNSSGVRSENLVTPWVPTSPSRLSAVAVAKLSLKTEKRKASSSTVAYDLPNSCLNAANHAVCFSTVMPCMLFAEAMTFCASARVDLLSVAKESGDEKIESIVVC